MVLKPTERQKNIEGDMSQLANRLMGGGFEKMKATNKVDNIFR